MKKLFLTLLAVFLYASPCHAQIIDIPEKILMIINKVNENLVVVQKTYQEYNNLKSQVKSGIMGSATVQTFKQIQKAYNSGKALSEKYSAGINVFSAFYDVLAAAEVLSNSIEYVDVMYKQAELTAQRKGATSEILAELDSKDEERLKDIISTLYARALKTRYENQLDYENYSEPNIDLSDETSILQAMRPVLEKTLRRKANVLFMESAMLEYNAFKALGLLPAENSDTSDDAPDSLTSSDELTTGGQQDD